MINDNDPPDNVVSFTKRKKETAFDVPDEIYANVYVKDGMVGLAVKDGEILLLPQHAIELCAVLISAMRVAINTIPEDKE